MKIGIHNRLHIQTRFQIEAAVNSKMDDFINIIWCKLHGFSTAEKWKPQIIKEEDLGLGLGNFYHLLWIDPGFLFCAV